MKYLESTFTSVTHIDDGDGEPLCQARATYGWDPVDSPAKPFCLHCGTIEKLGVERSVEVDIKRAGEHPEGPSREYFITTPKGLKQRWPGLPCDFSDPDVWALSWAGKHEQGSIRRLDHPRGE